MKLMKYKLKGKNYADFCFAGKRNFFFYIHEDYMGKKRKEL